MAKKDPKHSEAAPTEEAAASAAEQPTGEAQAEAAASAGAGRDADSQDAAALQAALQATEQEVERLKDAALRAQAEVENIRRRATKDVENAHKFALERFTSALLPALDGLEKSVDSAASTEDVKAVAEGVALSLKLLLDALRENGINQVDPLGEPFDPAQSEAMALVENPNVEPNSVMEVMQKGYLLNGRLVRAAKVIVAKAPEKAD